MVIIQLQFSFSYNCLKKKSLQIHKMSSARTLIFLAFIVVFAVVIAVAETDVNGNGNEVGVEENNYGN